MELVPLVLLFIGLLLLLRTAVPLVFQEEEDENHTDVRSLIDNRLYSVIRRPVARDMQKAADLLAQVRALLVQLIREVTMQLNTNPGALPNDSIREAIARLTVIHPGGDRLRLVQLDGRKAHTIALNRSKSEGIYLCLDGAEPLTLGGADTLAYVGIHELSHSITSKYAETFNGQTVHDDEFRQIEKYLMGVASNLGITKPDSIPGRQHCGVVIPRPDESM